MLDKLKVDVTPTVTNTPATPQEIIKNIDPTKIHIAKNEDLKMWADALNLSYDPENFVRGEIQAKIKEAVSVAQIYGRMRTVVFLQSHGESSEVIVSLNGKTHRYPKGEEVKIPEVFLNIIKEAVEYQNVSSISQKGQKPLKIPSYPYTVIE